jgi:F-type H+-transporting ATPase subunit alpha
MKFKADEIASVIQKEIEDFRGQVETSEVGRVLEVGDGIARVYGLQSAMAGEMVEFENGVRGLVFNLEENSVGVILLGDFREIKEGDEVKTLGALLSVPVGDALIGRVVDPLGNALDGKGPVVTSETRPVETIAPGIAGRQPVKQPLQTGIKAVDSMTPIGRGQRELIIGDRKTGKTAVALDTILAQKGGDVICVYVASGQRASNVAAVVEALEQNDAMDYTIVVSASASDPAPMQYIAPYAGAAIAEHFMYQGKHTLIVYDDLTKQAWAYRQVSLLLRRPPGREAYPGDVFYLHSRLLERAARVNEDYVEQFTEGEVKGKTGSLTALPIIETQAGDVSAFVPTNVISITDGQIFLESDKFNAGERPAMNPGISVSRVGGDAQVKFMSKISGGIKLALAQYRELAAFAQFASDLDEATRQQLEHGQRVTELMKQNQYSPMSVAEMGTVLFAANEGFLDDVDVDKVVKFEAQMLDWMRSEQKDLLDKINEKGDYNDEIAAGLKAALEKFKTTQSW